MIPVQKSRKDAKQATWTNNGSLVRTTPKQGHMTKDTNKGDKDKEVRQYMVSPIFVHAQIPEGMLFVARWYGSGPQDDTVKPAAKFSQHAIDRYWTPKRKRR